MVFFSSGERHLENKLISRGILEGLLDPSHIGQAVSIIEIHVVGVVLVLT